MNFWMQLYCFSQTSLKLNLNVCLVGGDLQLQKLNAIAQPMSAGFRDVLTKLVDSSVIVVGGKWVTTIRII